MTLLTEPDLGTPAVRATPTRRRSTIDGRQVDVPAGTSVMRAAAAGRHRRPQAVRHRLASRRSARAGCAWSRSTARKGTPGLVHDARAPRHGRAHPDRRRLREAAPRRHGALHLRPPARLPDLPGQRRLRAAGHGRRRRAARGPLRLRRRRTTSTRRPDDESNPYFAFDPTQVHRLLALRARLRRDPGHVRADHRGPRLRLQGRRRRGPSPSWTPSASRAAPACRPARRRRCRRSRSSSSACRPARSLTTCAYCGVGCSFKAELRGRPRSCGWCRTRTAAPTRATRCVKGRFACGYATPPRPRCSTPMVRETIDDAWREVVVGRGDRARSPRGFQAIQAEHGVGAIGGITSSRCTNEEVYVVQKMVRAAFGNNNVDTCARVCHSPTGYGLKQTFGTSAGTQDFQSVDAGRRHPGDRRQPDRRPPGVRLADEAAAARGRPADRRRPAPDRPGAHARTSRPRTTCSSQPGTNVAVVNAMAHVDRHRGAARRGVRRASAARTPTSALAFIADPENSPEAMAEATGVPAERAARGRPALRAGAATRAIYYGLGVTEHSQGSTMVMGMANLAMATGNIGREGVGVNPLRGQNNVQGSCDMGSFPHELPGYRHVSDDAVRGIFEHAVGTRRSTPSPGCASRTCSTPRSTARSGRSTSRARTSPSPTPTPSTSRRRCAAMDLRRRAGPVPQRDRPVRPRLPARHVVPGEGRHVHQRRAADQPGPPGDAASKAGRHEWEVTCAIGHGDGLPDALRPAASQIMDEIAATTPTFAGVSFARLDEVGSMQWPCNDAAPARHADHARRRRSSAARAASSRRRTCRPTSGATRKFPLILTTGRILSASTTSARRPGAPPTSPGTPRTSSRSTRTTPRMRGIADGDLVDLASRVGETTLRAADLRPDAARRRLHDVPPPGDRRQRGDDRELRLGDQLPGVQGDRRAGRGRQRARRPGRRRDPRARGDPRVTHPVSVPRRGAHGQRHRPPVRAPASGRGGRGDRAAHRDLLGPAHAPRARGPRRRARRLPRPARSSTPPVASPRTPPRSEPGAQP